MRWIWAIWHWGLPWLLEGTIFSSAEQECVVVEDEVAIGETKTFQLSMGIEREDRCMGAGLQAINLFKAP